MADRKGAFTLGGYTEEELAAMGFGEMTPMTRAGLAGDTIKPTTREQDLELSVGPEIAALLGYGSMPAKAYSGMVDDMGRSIGRAVNDPNTATIGDALQKAGAAATPFSPLGGAAALGLGAGTGIVGGLIADNLPEFVNSAQANAPVNITDAELPVQKARARYEADTKAVREHELKVLEINKRIEEEGKNKRLEIEKKAAAEEAAKARRAAEISRKAALAEAARQKVLDEADQVKGSWLEDYLRYSGGLEKTGAGAAFALPTAIATRGMSAVPRYLLPFLAGTSGAMSIGNAPYVAAMRGPMEHPQRTAARAYEEIADAEDPNLVKVRENAARYPAENPKTREAFDRMIGDKALQHHLGNLATSAIEGGLMGTGVAHMTEAGEQLVKGIPKFLGGTMTVPGEMYKGLKRGFKEPAKRGRRPAAKTRQTGASAPKAKAPAAPKEKPLTSTQKKRAADQEKRMSFAESAYENPTIDKPKDMAQGTYTKIMKAVNESHQTGVPVRDILSRKALNKQTKPAQGELNLSSAPLRARAKKLEEKK